MTMVQIVLFLSLAYLSLPAAAASTSCAREATTSPFCASSCCCSAQEDLKLREAFLGEVKAQGCEDDAACRSHLKAYICAANHGDPAQLTARRVFSMALPDQPEPTSSWGSVLDYYYYGGQILFRPTTSDPFLYLVTGPAQTDGQLQLQTNILRLRVGDMPSGNGTVTSMEAQVYTLVLGIPRQCAFDADRAQDLYYAIVKDDQELVYLISDPNASSYSATPPSPSLLVAHHRPTLGTPLSLVGGVLYRGYADATLVDSYIYMDSSQFLVTVASPARNSSTTRNLRVTCSASATSTCHGGDFASGRVISFGEDEGNNALLLATDGVYQVVGPRLCLAAIHTKTPMSTKRILEWVFGVIGVLLATLAGGYGICKCCNRKKNEIHVNAPNGNVNIFNGNNDIELGRMGVNN